MIAVVYILRVDTFCCFSMSADRLHDLWLFVQSLLNGGSLEFESYAHYISFFFFENLIIYHSSVTELLVQFLIHSI